MVADLHHFSLPHLLSECDQCFRVPDYWNTRVSRTHFCLFSPPCQRVLVAKGSTVPTQRAAASWSSKRLKPAVLKSTQVLRSRTDLLQAHWHDAYSPHVQREIPNPRGMQIHPSHWPPCPLLCIYSSLTLDCIYLFESCWGWQEASTTSSPVLFPAVPQRGTGALTTKLQQTLPEDKSKTVSSPCSLTYPRQTNGTSWQRGKLQAASLENNAWEDPQGMHYTCQSWT